MAVNRLAPDGDHQQLPGVADAAIKTFPGPVKQQKPEGTDHQGQQRNKAQQSPSACMPVVPNRMKALPRPRWWLQGRPAADPIDERSMARRVAAGRISEGQMIPGRWYPQGFKHGTAVLGQSLVTQGKFRIHGLLDDAQRRFQIFHPATHHFQEQGIEAAQSAKCPANGNLPYYREKRPTAKARHRRPAEPGLSKANQPAQPACPNSFSTASQSQSFNRQQKRFFNRQT